MIDVKHLSKSFGDHLVLDDISEHIAPGEKVVVIGPSGSGKSTFLRCLNLLETPTKGTITFQGAEITDPKADINKIRQQMGMVFQHFNLTWPPPCCGGWDWRRRRTPIPTSSPAAKSSASPSSGPWPCSPR